MVSEQQNQIQEDAMLAKMLQDQLFIQQLQTTYPNDFTNVFEGGSPQTGIIYLNE